jgi:hypothetical protein
VHRDVVDACIFFLVRIETFLPCAKQNNSMVDASSKLCKKIKHPLSSNKSLAIKKKTPNGVC